ncbi:MAG: hypothetical protein AB1601_07670 [Planctomycetota bacterium]
MNTRPMSTWSASLAALSVLTLAAAAPAAPEVWPFDLRTAGENVFYRSPTNVAPNADWYVAGWEITLAEVTVKYSIFPPVVLNITSELPPEVLQGQRTADGPAPIVIIDDRVVYPEPPEPPAVAADVEIGLDAAGFGYFAMTNVVLGQMEVNLPPFGVVTVQITALHLVGTVNAEAFWHARGDLNCDRAVDFGDINPFVLALTNPAAYAQAYPNCRLELADINGDGFVNFGDINPFVRLLTNP